MTREEHEELRGLAPVKVVEYRAELEGSIDSLLEKLRMGDPIEALAMTSFFNAFAWGDYFEPTSKASEAKPEYLAGLLAAVRHSAPDNDADINAASEVAQTVDDILELSGLLNVTEGIAAGDQPDATLKFMARARFLAVRGDSYAHHGQQLAHELYDNYADPMKASLGFSLEDVLAIEAGTTRLFEERINDLISGVTTGVDQAINAARSGKAPQNVMDALAELGEEELAHRMLSSAFMGSLGKTLSFTADDLSAASELNAETVTAVLEHLNLPLGEEYVDYRYPLQRSPLRDRPFVSWNGMHMLPVPGILARECAWVLEPHVARLSHNFPKRRAEILDELAVRFIKTMIPDATGHTNLFYDLQENGATKRVELDGLVLWAGFVFLIEGKATTIPEPAETGRDIRRLRTNIQDAIEDAWEQGRRAQQCLLENEETVFFDKRGEEIVRVRSDDIAKVFVINPTLHSFSEHASQLSRLHTSNLFPQGAPLSIFINDLRTIVEVVNSPAEFINYLDWRSRLLLRSNVVVSDEMDLFASYRLHAQYERKLALAGEDDPLLIVLGSTVDFDDYFMAQESGRPTGPKPRMFSQPIIDRYIESMITEQPEGWFEAVSTCLELSLGELAYVSKMAKQLTANLEDDELREWIPPPFPQEAEMPPEDGLSLGVVIHGRMIPPLEAWAAYSNDLKRLHRVVFLSSSSRGRPRVTWALTQPDHDLAHLQVSLRADDVPENRVE